MLGAISKGMDGKKTKWQCDVSRPFIMVNRHNFIVDMVIVAVTKQLQTVAIITKFLMYSA